jgi:hypothetical protein
MRLFNADRNLGYPKSDPVPAGRVDDKDLPVEIQKDV